MPRPRNQEPTTQISVKLKLSDYDFLQEVADEDFNGVLSQAIVYAIRITKAHHQAMKQLEQKTIEEAVNA